MPQGIELVYTNLIQVYHIAFDMSIAIGGNFIGNRKKILFLIGISRFVSCYFAACIAHSTAALRTLLFFIRTVGRLAQTDRAATELQASIAESFYHIIMRQVFRFVVKRRQGDFFAVFSLKRI